MNSYTDELRKIKSLAIVTALQRRPDLSASKLIEGFDTELNWKPLEDLGIEQEAWDYVTKVQRYEPKLVFCHPLVLTKHKSTSLYYRCLVGLSLKAARNYLGAVENLERGSAHAKMTMLKAKKMSRVYNMFMSSIIKSTKGSANWVLEDGRRTIIATMGITLDGTMRNKVGEIAEQRIRSMIFDYVVKNNLILKPSKKEAESLLEPPRESTLINGIKMRFSSEPDIAFIKSPSGIDEFVAIVEIKGGIDPAGALERYGAGTKSFQHALKDNPHCKNFFLSAVFTPELKNRIKSDRLVEKYFHVIEIIENPVEREKFFEEIFLYTLRLTKPKD